MKREQETKPTNWDLATEHYLLHQHDPGYATQPEHGETQVFGQKLKERIGQVMKEKGIV